MKQRISQWLPLSVRIPPELDDRIEAEANSRAVKKTIIVRERLARSFDMEPKGV
jgi:hypothetical protein